MTLPRGWLLLFWLIKAVYARGPLCLDCLAVDSPHECRTVTECGPQESCFASHFVWSHGTQGFSFGCRYTDRCTVNNPPSKRLESYRLCDSCCTGDLCNNNVCTNGTSPPIGLPCLQCDSISTTARCSHLTYCPEGDACYAENVSLLEDSLKLGCIPQAACSLIHSEIIGRRSSGSDSSRLRRVAACHECCQEPGCNHDACVSVLANSTENYIDTTTTTTTIAATYPRNCWDIKVATNTKVSGWYTVVSPEGGYLTVFCDMETDGGGWIVFQRRENGDVNFTRDYASYAEGFGSSKEFWMGNDKLHGFLTKGPSMSLRVDLCDWENETRYAVYKMFNVGPMSQGYLLTVAGYSGNAGDALDKGAFSGRKADGQRFSTPDKDYSRSNCSDFFDSGWWFDECYTANLNGVYRSQPTAHNGVHWLTWRAEYSLKTAGMKFRPSSAKPANHQPFICR